MDLEIFDETKPDLLLMMWHTESCRKQAETKTVEERITLSSPDGEARAVADGPELVARSDECEGIRMNAIVVLATNTRVYLHVSHVISTALMGVMAKAQHSMCPP